MAALSNSALVYMFEPSETAEVSTFGRHRVGTVLDPTTSNFTSDDCSKSSGEGFNYSSILFPALMISLSSSHGYLLVRLVIRHLLQRAFWKGSKEERQAKDADAEVKQIYVRSLVESNDSADGMLEEEKSQDAAFWERDDGIYELQGISKEL
jgi:anoctamin-10